MGLAIRERRQARGLSQEALAEAAHLHRTYVSMVERGKRNITVDSLDGVADALSVGTAELLRQAERARRKR